MALNIRRTLPAKNYKETLIDQCFLKKMIAEIRIGRALRACGFRGGNA